MTQEYAKTWNLDFKPNMKIWDYIEKQTDKNEKIGSIDVPGYLNYLLGSLVSNSKTALERRQLRIEVRKLICKMVHIEEQLESTVIG